MHVKTPLPQKSSRFGITWNKCGVWIVLAFSLALAALTSGCASPVESKIKMTGLPVAAVGHYGSMIGIPEYYINGRFIRNVSGWGGGGAESCCVALPLYPSKLTAPFMIHVKWTTCDVSHIKFINDRAVDPSSRCKETEHKATIPVNFAVETGDASAMYMHFLPGDRVEAWVSNIGPSGPKYQGPAYPRGPAPDYAPIVDRPVQADPNHAIKVQ